MSADICQDSLITHLPERRYLKGNLCTHMNTFRNMTLFYLQMQGDLLNLLTPFGAEIPHLLVFWLVFFPLDCNSKLNRFLFADVSDL